LSIEGKPDLQCSSDAPFRGDKSKHNPEDFFLAALSSCHMLWYLHLCADAGVIVTGYEDKARGTLSIENGRGRFTEVILHPKVFVADPDMIEKAINLHEEANKFCFIANSCNFEIHHKPEVLVQK
jgi:organic hydroperoxide reductase OsmC/OhrA